MKKSLVFVLVSAVLAAGCTTNTTNQTTVSHDAFLEKYVNQYQNNTQNDNNRTLRAWNVSWLNDTRVNVAMSIENKTSQTVLNENIVIMHFKSTDDATTYFNRLNITGYKLYENAYPGGTFQDTYQDVTGHAPVPYKYYVRESDPTHESWQQLLGDIVIVGEYTAISQTMIRN